MASGSKAASPGGYDVVVLGAGASGLTAAAVAALSGLSVLVLEKSRWLGGTSAISGGAPNSPGNPFMSKAAGDDDRASAETYFRDVLGNRYQAAMFDAFLTSSPQMLDTVMNELGVAFVGTPLPDYSPEAAGAKSGRIVTSPLLDARSMDRRLLALIRPPLPQLSLFGTMQISSADAPAFRNALRSWPAFRAVSGLVARHVRDLLLYGRATRLTNGRALVARLVQAADRQGVAFRTRAITRSLLIEDGAVRGVVLEGGETIRTKRGVILATGGFGANAELRRQYVPMADEGFNVQPESCSGDGLQLVAQAGGRVVGDNGPNALGTPMSVSRNADGSTTVFPHFAFDRHFPGSIVVGPDARRFFNEGRDYHKFVGAMIERGFPRAWLIGDDAFRRTYGMGLVKPWPISPRKYQKNGYLVSAPTVEALAARLGLDPSVLAATVAHFNDGAAKGVDPDFGRGGDAYSAFMGDHGHKPSPSLGPLLQGPFHAIELRPGDLSTFVGAATDEDARVLNEAGDVVPGLFAIGLDMAPISRGAYPSGGFGLGPGMTFGWRAARRLAEEARGA